MNSLAPLSPAEANAEIPALIKTLLDTERRLEELTAGEIDTVSDYDGRTFTLRHAQEQQRFTETAKQTAILNALPAHIALLDGQGLIVSVNDSWSRFARANYLLSPGAAMGQNYLAVCDNARGPDSSEARAAAAGIRAVLAGELKSFPIEYPCHAPNEQRWFLMTATPLSDQGPSGAVVMHVNITERKLAEKALLELALKTERRERMLSTMLSSISDFAYIFDTKGCFLFANEPLLKLWGKSLEALVGRNFSELGCPAELAAKLQWEVQEVFATRKSLTGETPYTTPTGEPGFSEYIFSPAFAADGSVDFVAGCTRDISERKKTEALLLESQQRLALATQSAHIGIWDLDVAANVLVWNAQMFELYGVGVDNFSGAYDAWKKRASPRWDRARAEEDFASALKGERDFHSEFRVVWQNSDVHHIEAHGIVQRPAIGPATRMIGVNWDITERKHAEIELEKTHGKLLEASRHAGMAEVATEVLHNVGNVLNSVNVASTCVAESIRKSKSADLTKISELLSEHSTDIGEFLTSDPHGKHVAAYIAELAAHLNDEQASMLNELAGLQKNVEHIKAIVRMQQNFAKVPAIREWVQPVDYWTMR